MVPVIIPKATFSLKTLKGIFTRFTFRKYLSLKRIRDVRMFNIHVTLMQLIQFDMGCNEQ